MDKSHKKNVKEFDRLMPCGNETRGVCLGIFHDSGLAAELSQVQCLSYLAVP